MAVQQLTQPIINPIAAFDATREHIISFVAIGGAQVVANKLVIQDNKTGTEVYSNIESNLRLQHTIPANTLQNGGYYNAVIQTIDNSNTLSSPSFPVPFYCYSQPTLTINNIPSSETIENGTYSFEGSYAQAEGELLNSYQFTLYNSNKEVLSQTPLIYYEADSSLTYTFVGMANDTAYYIELSGETVNNTKITSGLIYFTVRYIQPASFAICDLVNNCEDGYVQISSNIVAIDGHSNPDPPIYIDDKEVDLRDPDSWVEWNSGFRIQDDFTMRAWGRDFNDYQNIITLTNDINTPETPNKIELKWMKTDVIKELPQYQAIQGKLISLSDSKSENLKNVQIYGNTVVDKDDYNTTNPANIYSVGEIKNLINIPDFNASYSQEYESVKDTGFNMESFHYYTLSFDYSIVSATTDLYYTVGYGENGNYEADIIKDIQYVTQTNGTNSVSFIAPNNKTLMVKFANTQILADINVDISNIQLENGEIATKYETTNRYSVYPTVNAKNMFDYNNILYQENINTNITNLSNGFHIAPASTTNSCGLRIGMNYLLIPGNTYTVSYSQLGQFEEFKLGYIDNEGNNNEIQIVNNAFVAPNVKNARYLSLYFGVDNSQLTNYLEVWNIQLEANNVISDYEPYTESASVMNFENPLRSVGTIRDWAGISTYNLLNADTQTALVSENTQYYFSKNADYATAITLQFKNEDNNVISSQTLTSNSLITTPANCTQIYLSGISSSVILSNKFQIELGNTQNPYLPYVSTPSGIRNVGETILTGGSSENWEINNASNNTYVLHNLPNGNGVDTSQVYPVISNYFKANTQNNVYGGAVDTIQVLGGNLNNLYISFGADSEINSIDKLKTWLSQNNVKVIYPLKEPVVSSLSSDNVEALQSLQSYASVSNIYTNNRTLGIMGVEYVKGYSLQETVNAYVLLKCWNGNTMPYVIHSNYIDVPESTDNVFIWMRRKKNIFDLRIENLTKGE